MSVTRILDIIKKYEIYQPYSSLPYLQPTVNEQYIVNIKRETSYTLCSITVFGKCYYNCTVQADTAQEAVRLAEELLVVYGKSLKHQIEETAIENT